MRWFLALLGVLVGSAGSCQSAERMLLSGEDAFLVMPPKTVSNDMVMNWSLSPDGRFVLFEALDVKGKFSDLIHQMGKGDSQKGPGTLIKLYDSVKDEVTVVGKPGEEWNFSQTAWTVAPLALFATVTETVKTTATSSMVRRLVRIDLATKKSQVLSTCDRESLMSSTVAAAPKSALVVDVRSRLIDFNDASRKAEYTIVVYGADGREVSKSEFQSTDVLLFENQWESSGLRLLGSSRRREGKGMTASFALLEVPSGKIMTSTAEPAPYKPASPAPAPFIVQQLPAVISAESTKVGLTALWLVGTKPEPHNRALVAPDMDGQSVVTPDFGTIYYMDKSRLYNCEIVKVDKEMVLNAIDAAARTAALSRAKQVALAALLFATDNDDLMPSRDSFGDKLGPYLKDNSLLDGFVYTYSGGRLTDVADPSKTVLGYVDTNGGRCVAYVDGHVKFVKN
ncbi:MAG: hypothetical protein JSS66_14130 [Armatimonadetes bacterium]|nr:hypothetical protein [Armatimonadota bacterium]